LLYYEIDIHIESLNATRSTTQHNVNRMDASDKK